jgi:soluble lytic murein transglycosylase
MTLARLGTARLLLAGAAILAGAAGPARTQANTAEETALAIPRIATPGAASAVALPQPLSPSEAQRVRRVFALQAKNDIPAAIAECEQLSETTLLGDILADRYLGGSFRAKPDELRAWLAKYRDLTDASAVYALLASQRRHGALPATPEPVPALPPAAGGDDIEFTARLMTRNPALDRSIRDAARSNASRAVRLIAHSSGVDRLYGAQLRAEVAQILFTQGRDSEALSVAQAAHLQAQGENGLAPYIAGLAAWRLNRPSLAQLLFESAYKAPLTQPGQRAGAAFWAARAHLRNGDGAGYAPWMQRAAGNPRTFYGLLARRSLGQQLRSDPSLERATLGEADVDAVDAMPAGRHAFALLQVGQDARAALALQKLWSETRERPGFTRSIMLVARAAGLTALADQLDALVEPASVHLPARRLRPAGGFRTDPALLYALARMESNFDAKAVSPMGARGLLQLMPRTVDFILGEDSPRARRLHDPAVNLDLGQRYLRLLAQYDLIGGDLIRLLASYNSGPGSFGRWAGSVRHNGDPLLFMESVPNDETRAYIPRVLAYSWLYAAELGLPSPSLDELAAGSWPRFRPDAPKRELLARLH